MHYSLKVQLRKVLIKFSFYQSAVSRLSHRFVVPVYEHRSHPLIEVLVLTAPGGVLAALHHQQQLQYW